MKGLGRLATVVALTAIITAAAALPAFADAPKFHSASSSVNSAGALVVSFDERGLGNEDISYSLRASATASYACINGGGRNPSAENKRSTNGDVAGGGTFKPENGRVRGSVSAGPISAGDFSCPPGQRMVLTAVSYWNIVLTDTTNGVSTSAPNVSRTFYTV